MTKISAMLAAAAPEVRARVLASLGADELRAAIAAFPEWAHGGQTAPSGDWRTWVIVGGRGFGKTRAGAEWVLGVCRFGRTPSPRSPAGESPSPQGRGVNSAQPLRIALVGATVAEARRVMVEGPSGILACAQPGEIVRWARAEGVLQFASGAEARVFSGASPEGLRGPEHDFAWCDELGKWRHAEAAWDMLQMGLRRGPRPRAVVTTTPRRCAVLSRILDAPDTEQTGGATRANPHLSATFVADVERDYAGTALGAQEIEGRMPGELAGALWTVAGIARSRVFVESPSPRSPPGESPSPLRERVAGVASDVSPSPRSPSGESPSPRGERGFSCVRIVVGVDPPATAAGTCGIVVAGRRADGVAVVLADRSVGGASPEGWATAVAEAVAEWQADRVVVEVNQGGDMVTSVLRAADAALPIETVNARRGKAVRAEPVAALFESGRAVFGGIFPELEAELRGFVAGGYGGAGSPDRADAMVWALWALMLKVQRAVPRITAL